MDSDQIRFSLNADRRQDGTLFLTSDELEGFTSVIDDERQIDELIPSLQAFASLQFDREIRKLRLDHASENRFSFIADARTPAIAF